MDLGIISMRYARALLRFAIENKEEEKVYAETERMAQAFLKVEGLQQTLLNPIVNNRQKQQLLIASACDKEKPTTSLQRFVELTVAKGRADLMMFVANSYGTLYRKKKNIIKGKLVVPTAVNGVLVEKLQEMVEKQSGCKIDFKVEENAAIEGGFILEYDTYRLDASVHSQLAKLKRELVC